MSSNKSTSQRPRGRQSPREKYVNTKSPPAPPQQAPASNQGAPPKEPGMFQRVAETAAGVAVGSTVGNLVSSAISGLFGSSDSKATTPEKPAEINPCEKQKLILEHCMEKENDLTKCEELQKEYKECRVKYNLP